ncbi:hypothetical protein ACETAC_02385 [Aceticella autotrophica]|uniref:Uncharacterized protein n=1 Tax=Aceticella autotrophica TaxID=2755338 RepID=A0A975AWK0_9THEO|nr:hypothetical protein [Aceticella autotrophica]QSZ27767.1 hypothetical protein ACETAC_02385 [Aceticella autotrophica]
MKSKNLRLNFCVQKIFRKDNISSIFAKALALIAISLLIIRSISVADISWDSLSYHLPFAAMRVGLLSPHNFVLPEYLIASYNGFPSAIYYLKGLLWLITGRPEAVQLVSILSIILFALFTKKTLNVSAEWIVIGILSIPLIQIGASANMVDVPANMGMAMVALSLYKLLIKTNEITKQDFIWLLVACLIASGSKPQSIIVGNVIFGSYVVVFLLLRKKFRLEYSNLKALKSAIFWLILCGFAISYPALLNTYRYGNPIYPMALNIGSLHLQGVYTATNWQEPAYLNSLPQVIRWLLSVLEFHAYDLRPIPYSIDQGNVPLSSKSFRMGGYFLPLILMSLFVIMLSTKRMRRDYARRGLLFLFCITIFVSSLPGSNELRYYSFWAVLLVVIAIAQLEWNKNNQALGEIFLFYKAFLVISFLFIIFITGAEYFKWTGPRYSDLVSSFERNRKVFHSNEKTVFFYDVNDFRGAIFDSAIFSDPNNIVLIRPKNNYEENGINIK